MTTRLKAVYGAVLSAALLLFVGGLALSDPVKAHSEFTGIEVERPESLGGSSGNGGDLAVSGPDDHRPALLTLAFSEELDPGFARVEVRDADDRKERVGSVAVTGDRLHLEVEIPSIPDGSYTVGWFVRSQDGDSSNGSARFSLGDAVSPSSLLPPVGARDPAWQPPMTWRMTSVSAVLRWFNYLGSALAVGALFFRAFVWPAARVRRMPGFRELLFAGLGLLFLTNILLVLLQASFVQLATLQPVDTVSPVPLDPSGLTQARAADALGEILATWSGGVWLARMGLIVLLGLSLWRMPHPTERRNGWFVGAVAGGALLFLTISLTSHAAFVPTGLAATGLAVGLDWTHLLAMALWLGGLPPLYLALRREEPVLTDEARRRLLHRFSPLALGAVSYLGVTGVAASYFQVGDPLLLFRTVYGVTLDVKLVLVGLLVGMGAINRYVLIPRSDGGTGPSGFTRTLPVEIALGCLLLLSVAMLASLGAAATVWPAHRALGLSETVERDDVRMTARVAPGDAGDNAIAVDVTDRRNTAWRTPGSLRVEIEHAGEPSSDAQVTDRLTAENTMTERYLVPRLYDLEAGERSVSIRLERPGYAPVEGSFQMEIGREDD